MGRADFYEHGSYNMLCDLCGRKFKARELRKQWDGLMVCADDYSARHPQDMVRGIPDRQAVPVARPEGSDQFLETNDVQPEDL
jgi:hypothetical protein